MAIGHSCSFQYVQVFCVVLGFSIALRFHQVLPAQRANVLCLCFYILLMIRYDVSKHIRHMETLASHVRLSTNIT